MTRGSRHRFTAIAAAALLVLAQPTATVAFNCHPPRAANTLIYGAGRSRVGTSSTTFVRAARAIMDTNEFPYVEYPNESASYVEIKNSQPTITYYARIGWLVRDIDDMWFFTQYNGPGTYMNIFQATHFPDAAFRVVWNNPPGNGWHQFSFWDGPNYAVQTLVGNPVLNWSPDEGQIGTRTESRESQFPGRVANRMEMKVTQAFVNGVWVPFRSAPLIGFSTASWANFVDVSTDTMWFRSWDADCP